MCGMASSRSEAPAAFAAGERSETRVRSRTRRAILDAAVAVLGENRRAPLAEVAREAGVSRSTLQRYFAERSDLESALVAYAEERIVEAVQAARIGEGTGAEAYARLTGEYFSLGNLVLVSWDGTEAEEEVADPDEEVMVPLVQRGHADGTLDPRIGPRWADMLLWSGLYASWLYARRPDVSQTEARALCVYSAVKAAATEEGVRRVLGGIPLPTLDGSG
ncbi:hypothetical protein GCM10027440_35000 [Nocardiopsis coralliicola]